MTKPPTKPKPPEPTLEEVLEYQRQDQGRMDGWRNEPKEKKGNYILDSLGEK